MLVNFVFSLVPIAVMTVMMTTLIETGNQTVFDSGCSRLILKKSV